MTEPSRQDEIETQDGGADPLSRFRNWRGFLFVAVAVNLLFLYGMVSQSFDSPAGVLVKSLTWLPFNVIATVLYYVFMIKMGPGNAGASRLEGRFYAALSAAMIALNWIAMFNT